MFKEKIDKHRKKEKLTDNSISFFPKLCKINQYNKTDIRDINYGIINLVQTY